MVKDQKLICNTHSNNKMKEKKNDNKNKNE